MGMLMERRDGARGRWSPAPVPLARSLKEKERDPTRGCMGGEGAGKGQTHEGRGMLSKEEADCIVVTKIE